MTKTLIGIACVLAATCVANAEEPSFQFRKEISAVGKAEETLVSVALDSDVYAATQIGLADVRVQDASGKAIPFVIRKSRTVKSQTVHRHTWTARLFKVRPLADNGLEITLTLDKDDPAPNGLRLISELKNFEQRVRVLTSVDGENWEPAGNEAIIFDYSRYMDFRNDQVPFPSTTRKHVRVIIDDVTSDQQSELLELTRRLRGAKETERTERITIDRRPFRINRIEFWQDVPAEGDGKQVYLAAGFKVVEDSKTRQTIVQIETHREPLTQIAIETSSRNFSRNCVVEVPEKEWAGGKVLWASGSATLSRLDFKSLKREDLSVPFPEMRYDKYRLVIDNRDSEPLKITGVKLEGNVYEVNFLSATNQPYQLLYGNPDAQAPQYDTAAIETLLKEKYRPETLKLGPQQKVVGAAPPAFKWSRVINDPRLLTGIIGLLVLVLGWALYVAVKQIDSSPPTEPPQPPTT